MSYYTQTDYKDVQSSMRATDQTVVRPLLTTLTILQCADPHALSSSVRNEGMGARRRSVCLLQAVTDARSNNSQLHSLAVNVPCAVVTASHLNSAFKQTFSIRCRLHYNLIKVCKKLQMSKCSLKRLTLAKCVDVQCRPTVEVRHSLHSAYLHTPLMWIAPWQSGAYALKQSALY